MSNRGWKVVNQHVQRLDRDEVVELQQPSQSPRFWASMCGMNCLAIHQWASRLTPTIALKWASGSPRIVVVRTIPAQLTTMEAGELTSQWNKATLDLGAGEAGRG